MAVINQPFQGQLGTILINEIKQNYSSLTIFSAFAKNSGVLRLKEAIEKHRSKGGCVTAFIGIDLDGTSYEALLNLFSLCDNLYVIHSKNFSTTYHSKIYLLEKSDKAWCAVGSNNLTGGGLWTNFESCNIETYKIPDEQECLASIHEIVEKYTNSAYKCSFKISSIDDINVLLDAKYITKEISQRIENISKRKAQQKRHKKTPLFGSEKVTMPTVSDQKTRSQKGTSSTPVKVGDSIDSSKQTKQPSFTNEQFWFEMRKSTGGSHNILDLSKLGKIAAGAVSGTAYEYPQDLTLMYGGVKFFEVDPEDTFRTKNITINYLGKDYFPSTIKFTAGNGSWRIQLKGKPSDGTEELSKFGNRGVFENKILVFEKINPDYYVLSLLEDIKLQKIKDLSQVWGHNGNSSKSRAYGML